MKHFNPDDIPSGMNGNNIAHLCALNGNQKILSEIIQTGLIDINANNDSMEKPINIAIVNSKLDLKIENYEIIDILLNAHCTVTQEHLKIALEVVFY